MMNHIEDINREMGELYVNMKAKKIGYREGREMHNVAGRMIAAANAQLKYYALRKEAPEIPFFTVRQRRA